MTLQIEFQSASNKRVESLCLNIFPRRKLSFLSFPLRASGVNFVSRTREERDKKEI